MSAQSMQVKRILLCAGLMLVTPSSGDVVPFADSGYPFREKAVRKGVWRNLNLRPLESARVAYDFIHWKRISVGGGWQEQSWSIGFNDTTNDGFLIYSEYRTVQGEWVLLTRKKELKSIDKWLPVFHSFMKACNDVASKELPEAANDDFPVVMVESLDDKAFQGYIVPSGNYPLMKAHITELRHLWGQ